MDVRPALSYQQIHPWIPFSLSHHLILIVRSLPAAIFHRLRNAQRRRVAPAVSTILASFSRTFPAINDEKPGLILHIFSNGGSHQALNLRLAYRETTSAPFPPLVTIFDSCPGRATFKRSVLALSSDLPQLLAAMLRILVALTTYPGTVSRDE